jgi:demethylmenaquinone methyltransferase / 2-methoxy-6-polyprenyl-1,4-benzoquinol methylase
VPPSSAANAAAFDAAQDDVFSRIADRYDLLCDVFSLMIHRVWKRAMARRVLALPWQEMMDAAGGTGDIALRVARGLAPSDRRRVIVTDLCERMLTVAQRRAGTLPLAYRRLDAHALADVPSGSIDLYALSFAMKILDRERVLREAFRVLRPGGTFMCLEASQIPFAPLRRAYLAYMDVCLPTIALVATRGDRSAYDYFLKGIHDFPDADGFASEIRAHGFTDVSYERMTLGTVAIHTGRKPGSLPA